MLRRLIAPSLLLLLSCLPCLAQSVSVTGPTSVNSGQVATLKAHLSNTLSPGIATLTAGATYQDAAGNQYSVVALPLVLNITHPETFSAVTFTLPGNLSYVTGSATSTVVVTGTVASGVLTLGLGPGAVLTDGQSLDISFGLKAQ
jgi:hypothetical protein